MLRLIASFTLFILGNSFSQYNCGNKLINHTYKLDQLKKIISVISPVNSEEPLWDDGEVPWDFRPDNKTSVKTNKPKKPNLPLISSTRGYMLAMLLQ